MELKIDGKIWNKLVRLGFRPDMKGTWYICRAAELWRPGAYLTKEIYPVVAKEFGTSWTAVERSVRATIAYTWDHRNGRTTDVVELFGPWGMSIRPRASELVGAVGAWRWTNEN